MSIVFLFSFSISFAWSFQGRSAADLYSIADSFDVSADAIFRRGVDIGNELERNIEPLVLTTSVLDAPVINFDYQYEDHDIAALLQLRAEEEGLNLDNTIILAPLSDTAGDFETQLREENIRYRNRIIKRENIPHDRTILVPLNLTQLSHWVGIVIRLDGYSNIQSINFIDSLGGNVPAKVRETLQNIYGYDIQIENTQGLLQTDMTSCGPMMIENMIGLIMGDAVLRIVSPELVVRIRARHIIILEKGMPNINFKKRQQHNVRSFKDINGNSFAINISSVNAEKYSFCLQAGLSSLVCGGGDNGMDFLGDNTSQGSDDEVMEEQDDKILPVVKSMATGWDSLPEELKVEILKNLSAKKIFQTSTVSKDWQRIASDNILWLDKIRNEFSEKIFVTALAIYDEDILEIEANTSNNPADDSQNQDAEKQAEMRNFATVHYICQLLKSHGSKETKRILSKKRGELIEIDSRNHVLNIQRIVEKITSPNSRVKALVIKDITVTKNQVLAILEALKNPNCRVNRFVLWPQRITDIGIPTLSRTLRIMKGKIANLVNIKNEASIAEVIAQTLKDSNCKITELGLYGDVIDNGSVHILTEALSSLNCKITRLTLAYNNIESLGAHVLAEALKSKSCQLEELVLEGNQIGPSGARALAKALRNSNCKLTILDLTWGLIQSEGAQALAEAFKNPNCKIVEFNAAYNDIYSVGAKALAEAIRNPNCQLTKLNLDSNNIADSGILAIAEALRDPNCKIVELNLLGNDGIRALVDVIKSQAER